MGATGHKGIDIRQTANRLIVRASLKDSTGAKVTSGSASLYLYELQDDGTLKSYDFNDDTFKTGTLTTETASLTHRAGNNGATITGLWTYVLSTVSGFTAGAIYFAVVSHSSASPPQQEREFQFGSAQGDVVVTSGRPEVDVKALAGSASSASNLERSASTIYRGTISGSSTTTALVDSGLTQADTDFWKGRIVIFTSGALAGQATDITAVTPATDTLTVTALTSAPSVSDTYVIV